MGLVDIVLNKKLCEQSMLLVILGIIASLSWWIIRQRNVRARRQKEKKMEKKMRHSEHAKNASPAWDQE